MEQHRFLQNQAHVFAQRALPNLTNVNTVELHRARCRVVKTRNEADDGRLAGSRRADECSHLPRLNPETHVDQSRALRVVSKSDMVELDSAFDVRQLAGARHIANFAVQIEHSPDPFVTDRRLRVSVRHL